VPWDDPWRRTGRTLAVGVLSAFAPTRWDVGVPSYGDLDAIFRGGVVDLALVREQWDQLVRAAASLKRRTSPAHVVLERLASSSDRLARDLTALGRLVKSTYILRYVNDPAIRRRVQLQLNRAESRHTLARRLFFANQGVFRSGDYEEIMNKVSALSLLSNAALVWNTVRIGEVVAELEKVGEAVTREQGRGFRRAEERPPRASGRPLLVRGRRVEGGPVWRPRRPFPCLGYPWNEHPVRTRGEASNSLPGGLR
jgi:hypothetical protein